MRIELEVNGEAVVREIEPRLLLSDLIREELGLTGTHIGCSQGVCGACTVQVDGRPVRSCIVLAAQIDGATVRTVEALTDGLPPGEVHPLQQAFKERHALQCGFCTAGFLMTLEPLLATPGLLATDEQIRNAISGNLCRCTGYQHIVEAVRVASSRSAANPTEEIS